MLFPSCIECSTNGGNKAEPCAHLKLLVLAVSGSLGDDTNTEEVAKEVLKHLLDEKHPSIPGLITLLCLKEVAPELTEAVLTATVRNPAISANFQDWAIAKLARLSEDMTLKSFLSDFSTNDSGLWDLGCYSSEAEWDPLGIPLQVVDLLEYMNVSTPKEAAGLLALTSLAGETDLLVPHNIFAATSAINPHLHTPDVQHVINKFPGLHPSGARNQRTMAEDSLHFLLFSTLDIEEFPESLGLKESNPFDLCLLRDRTLDQMNRTGLRMLHGRLSFLPDGIGANHAMQIITRLYPEDPEPLQFLLAGVLGDTHDVNIDDVRTSLL